MTEDGIKDVIAVGTLYHLPVMSSSQQALWRVCKTYTEWTVWTCAAFTVCSAGISIKYIVILNTE